MDDFGSPYTYIAFGTIITWILYLEGRRIGELKAKGEDVSKKFAEQLEPFLYVIPSLYFFAHILKACS